MDVRVRQPSVPATGQGVRRTAAAAGGPRRQRLAGGPAASQAGRTLLEEVAQALVDDIQYVHKP